MPNLLFITLAWLLPLGLCGQTISGKVQENNGRPVTGVNVLLLDNRDSAMIKGTVSDGAGEFVINNIPAGKYLLSASSVGYSTHVFPVTVNRTNPVKIPPITLKANTSELKQVEVTGKKPFIEQRIDRMIVNVAGSIIASGSTALDILEKTPGVTVDQQNDLLSLRGKEGVIVQIDGKQTYLPVEQVVAMLRNIPGGNIERIEVITNPSARYDAEGNAGIIDIRLKKNNNIGTNGSISLGVGSGRYDRERGALQINHKTSRLNLFGSYAVNRGGNYWDFTIDRDQADGAQRNIIHQTSFIKFRNSGHNAKAGVDFHAGKSTTLGIAWTGFFNNSAEESPAHAAFTREPDGSPYLQTLTDKTLSNNTTNHVGNFNVQHTFKNNRGQLTADIDIGRFHRDFFNSLHTETLFPADPPEPEFDLLSIMPTDIDIFTVKSDYSRSYKNGWNIQAGYKSSFVRSVNDMKITSGENGNLQPDTALSNNFRYKENINSLYGNVNGKLNEKTELQAGLRIEHTVSDANSITQAKQTKRDYINFFPSIFLTRTLDKKQSLTFSYSHRINRPNYQSLNPVRSYLDPYAFSRGNPFLKPDYTHSIEVKHGYKGKIFTSLGAGFTRDMIFFVIRPIDNKITERTPENIGKMKAFNLTVTFPVNVMQGWTMQYTATGNYSTFKYVYIDETYNVKQFSGRVNLSNAFVFGKGWTGELNGWVSTPGVQALFRSAWNGTVDVGIQKVLSPALKLKLSGQDLLHTNQVRSRIITPDFTSYVNIVFDTRVVMLNLTYQFGNQQLKSNRARKSSSEEELQRIE